MPAAKPEDVTVEEIEAYYWEVTDPATDADTATYSILYVAIVAAAHSTSLLVCAISFVRLVVLD